MTVCEVRGNRKDRRHPAELVLAQDTKLCRHRYPEIFEQPPGKPLIQFPAPLTLMTSITSTLAPPANT